MDRTFVTSLAVYFALALQGSAIKTYLENSGLNDPKRLFPATEWAPKYSVSKLVGDAVAGLTVGLMVLPQSLAYAGIAGLPNYFGVSCHFASVCSPCTPRLAPLGAAGIP